MNIEDIVQPTEPVTQDCPSCGRSITDVPYDIGSGPEMSCSDCELCWGANGQELKQLPLPTALSFKSCGECGETVAVPWPGGVAPTSCSEHT